MRRTILLGLTLVALLAELTVACSRKTRTVVIPAGHSQVNVAAAFPASAGISATCALTRSWLLRLDTSGDGTWDYVLLFDSSLSTVYGCNGACPPNTDIARELTSLRRVELEGISAAPAVFAQATGGISVLCRGVADADVVPSSIVDDTSGTLAHSFSAEVAVLKVGGSNPLPFSAGDPVPPQARYAAGASLSSTDFGIGRFARSGSPNGRIVLGGGTVREGQAGHQTEYHLWEFDPGTLKFAQSPFSLTQDGVGVAGQSATLYDHDGVPTVLFAGGATDAPIAAPTGLLRRAALYHWNGSVEYRQLVDGGSGRGRAFHAASFLRRSPSRSVIVLLGGWSYSPAADVFSLTSGDIRNDYEYFVPPGSSAGGACSGVSGDFCRPSATTLSLPRGRLPAAYFEENFEPKIWLPLGVSLTLYPSGDSTTEHFNGVSDGAITPGPTITGIASFETCAAVITSSGESLMDGTAFAFGGFSGDGATDLGYNLGYIDSTGPQPYLFLRESRGACRANLLRDHTVLISGGASQRRGTGALAVEQLSLYIDTSQNGRTQYVPSGDPSLPKCNVSQFPAGPACSSLIAGRWGHVAISFEETGTWLDGSILISGGGNPADSAAPHAELFVPAMTCDSVMHAIPVHPVTQRPAVRLSNPTLLPICDRNRGRELITDPRTGSLVSP